MGDNLNVPPCLVALESGRHLDSQRVTKPEVPDCGFTVNLVRVKSTVALIERNRHNDLAVYRFRFYDRPDCAPFCRSLHLLRRQLLEFRGMPGAL
jgi:hypothetical protein